MIKKNEAKIFYVHKSDMNLKITQGIVYKSHYPKIRSLNQQLLLIWMEKNVKYIFNPFNFLKYNNVMNYSK